MKTRLIAYLSENIGQMPDYLADDEVDRMRRQTGNPNWHKDYSDEMDCPDDCMYRGPVKRTPDWKNPINGITYVHCWVTCSNNVIEIDD